MIRFRCAAAVLCALAAVGAPLAAQGGKSASLQETADWLVRELPSMGTYDYLEDAGIFATARGHVLSDIHVDQCRMSFVSSRTITKEHLDYRFTVPLRAVNRRSIVAEHLHLNNGWIPWTWTILFRASANSQPFTFTRPEGDTVSTGMIVIDIPDSTNAVKVAHAINRVAELCGAPSSP